MGVRGKQREGSQEEGKEEAEREKYLNGGSHYKFLGTKETKRIFLRCWGSI